MDTWEEGGGGGVYPSSKNTDPTGSQTLETTDFQWSEEPSDKATKATRQ